MIRKKNNLKNEKSSYLIKHSSNPVNWYPWDQKSLKLAAEENKIIILSIGYSTCHWCHVMERESFQNESIAKYMNKHFISIKVDREERPDIDNIYMDALQIMGIQGGWPLNIFLMPNRKPFYGGTYFSPDKWLGILKNIVNVFKNHRDEIIKSSNIFTDDLKKSHDQKYGSKETHLIQSLINEIKIKFDYDDGGMMREPKFPMPSLWNSLLFYSIQNSDIEIFNHIKNTVDNIINGGIYDQLKGGIARYSTDKKWIIPHFEKMIYDNGQFLELISNLFKITKDEKYKFIIKEIAEWIMEDMTDKNGGFYSAIDADSDEEEGKYYIWDNEELKKILGADYQFAKKAFRIERNGNWENKSILLFNKNLKRNSKEIKKVKLKLNNQRNKRNKPKIDKKIISSWNAILLFGLIDAYQATKDDKILKVVEANAKFIKNNLIKKNKKIIRVYDTEIFGFLDDYAFTIRAFIKFYETTQKSEYLEISKDLMEYAIKNFYSKKDSIFYFSGKKNEKLITNKIQIFDDVIPSSNSIMFYNLLILGKLYNDPLYLNIYNSISKKLEKYLNNYEFMSNWIYINQMNESKINEITIYNSSSNKIIREINSWYIPNKIIKLKYDEGDFDKLNMKAKIKKPSFILCRNKVCMNPLTSLNKLKETIIKKKNS